MDAFTIRVAGLISQVQPNFLSTREYCKKYLSIEEPEVFVTVTSEDILYEQRMADIEADEEGLKRRKFTDPFLERAAIQHKIADELIKRNVLMIHGSTVALDDGAYLFTAACGTGKSTHTRLWCEVFGDRARMVNDDKPFLEILPNMVIVHGSPWSGKTPCYLNESAPIAAMVRLVQAPENRFGRKSDIEAFALLLPGCSVLRFDRNLYGNLCETLIMLAEMVCVGEMRCLPDKDAAQICWEGVNE